MEMQMEQYIICSHPLVQCEFCDKHFKNRNGRFEKVEMGGTEKKSHKCRLCSNSYENRSVQTQEKTKRRKGNTTETRKCRCCGKTFINTATLASHEYRIRKRRKMESKEQVDPLEKAEKDEAEENLEVEVITPAKAASNNQKIDELENVK